MAFDSFLAFLAMGKYGAYVWSAYGLGAVVLIGLVINTITSRRKEYQKLTKRYLRERKS